MTFCRDTNQSVYRVQWVGVYIGMVSYGRRGACEYCPLSGRVEVLGNSADPGSGMLAGGIVGLSNP
jgi:hypothetical protein